MKTTTSTRQNTAHSPGQELRSRPSPNFASYYKSGFHRSQNYNSPNTVVIHDHTLTARRVALPPFLLPLSYVTPLRLLRFLETVWITRAVDHCIYRRSK